MALTITHLATKNAGDKTATASITPTAGGALLACITSDGSDADPSVGGTLTGTWTKAARHWFNNQSTSIFWCADYGASGTVLPAAVGNSWHAVSVIYVADTGLSTVLPIKNTKTALKAGGAGLSVTATLDDAPTHTTFGVSRGDPTMTAGAGFTRLTTTETFDVYEVIYSDSATGTQAVVAVSSSTNQMAIVAGELGYAAQGNSPKFARAGRRRRH